MRAAADLATVLRWEWFRLWRRTAFRVTIGLVIAVVVLIQVGIALLPNIAGEGGLPPSDFPSITFQALNTIGPYLGILLAVIIFNGEYGWGTLRVLVARGQPRWGVALARLLLLTITLAAVWAASFAVSGATGLIVGAAGEPGAGEAGKWGEAATLGLGGLPTAITYMSLAMLLCVVGRSVILGLVVSAVILIGDGIIYNIAEWVIEPLYDVSLTEYLRWTPGQATSGLVGGDDIAAWHFAPAVLGYIAAFWGLTIAALTRQDLTSGSG